MERMLKISSSNQQNAKDHLALNLAAFAIGDANAPVMPFNIMIVGAAAGLFIFNHISLIIIKYDGNNGKWLFVCLEIIVYITAITFVAIMTYLGYETN